MYEVGKCPKQRLCRDPVELQPSPRNIKILKIGDSYVIAATNQHKCIHNASSTSFGRYFKWCLVLKERKTSFREGRQGNDHCSLMVTAVIWLKFCRYGVKLLINQSINWVAAIKDALLRVFSYSGVPVEKHRRNPRDFYPLHLEIPWVPTMVEKLKKFLTNPQFPIVTLIEDCLKGHQLQLRYLSRRLSIYSRKHYLSCMYVLERRTKDENTADATLKRC